MYIVYFWYALHHPLCCCYELFSLACCVLTTPYTFIFRMSTIPLSKLSLGDRDVTIQVQITRKWEYKVSTDDGPILHLDMVVADV
jgi:hypothetical protein